MSELKLDTRALTLLTVALDSENTISSEGLGGITRLQKYLFLLDMEEQIKPVNIGFDFTAYKAGPYSSKLYDDLEFLENLGLIETEITAEATEAEVAEVDLLSFDDLMGDSSKTLEGPIDDSRSQSDSYEERKFKLTSRGKAFAERLVSDQSNEKAITAIKKIKKKFKKYTLTDLLKYVYTKYPDMTVESEIKERILGRN